MENLLLTLIKFVVIFAGGGLSMLLAGWVLQESISIPDLIFKSGKKTIPGKVAVTKNEKLSMCTGIYELKLPDGDELKIFSSQKGIKII